MPPLLASLTLSPIKACVALALGTLAALSGWILGPAEFRFASMLLAFGLCWASVVDFDRFILPDILTLGLAIVGLALSSSLGQGALLNHVIGAAVGYLSLVLVALAYRRWRGREGLGRGDAKLLAAAGAWLGWAALPTVLLMASLSAIVWVVAARLSKRALDRSDAIAFGPFIAIGFWGVWLFGAAAAIPYDTMSSH